MAFIWIPVSAGDIARASHVVEVQDNTNLLADDLGIAHPAWSNEPIVSIGDKMTAAQITELQDALDYIDTNNVCSANNGAYYTGNLATNDATVYSGRDVTIYSNVETGNLGANYATDNGVRYGTNQSPVQTTNYGVYNTVVYSGRDITAYSGKSLP